MDNRKERQAEFLGFQDELKSFVYRLLTNYQDAEDVVQDSYIRAFKYLDSFKGDSSFKTWVFAIATNLARDRLKHLARWREDFQDNCRRATYASQAVRDEFADVAQNSPHGKFVLEEHIDYCFSCMAKTLLLEEQICLILKEVYQFKVQEIMHITALSEGKVKHALADARKRFHRIFDGRCSLISKQGACHQCTELNGIFNPRQNAEQETRKIKMVKERESADFEKLLDLRYELVRNIDPLKAEGFDLHNFMIENLPRHSE